MAEDDADGKKWHDAVVSVLDGTGTGNEPIKVKKLRKMVLLSLQHDETDKTAKKIFKRTIQTLEETGGVHLDEEGNVTLKKKRKRKEEKKSSKKKRRNDDDNDDQNFADDTGAAPAEPTDRKPQHPDDKDKNIPCKGNPQGATRLFLGNLPFAVDETTLEAHLPGLTHVKWITDKETGKFYGSAFVEMNTAASAAEAVAKAGSQLLGRPVKVNYAPATPGGDPWPPDRKVVTGGRAAAAAASAGGDGAAPGGERGGQQAGGTGVKAMSAKPDNCLKLFIGNLSYEIDDDAITKFFASVDAEVKAVRWLHHKDTGDFKGVYVAFFG